jgi:hypothetical protein
MSEDKDLIVRRAIFGKQVDNFFSSDIGKYLLARADDEAEQALVAFKTCDPTDVSKVTGIQNKILQSENFKTWLEEAVMDGLQALNILEDRE